MRVTINGSDFKTKQRCPPSVEKLSEKVRINHVIADIKSDQSVQQPERKTYSIGRGPSVWIAPLLFISLSSPPRDISSRQMVRDAESYGPVSSIMHLTLHFLGPIRPTFWETWKACSNRVTGSTCIPPDRIEISHRPLTVQTLGPDCFMGCAALRHVSFHGPAHREDTLRAGPSSRLRVISDCLFADTGLKMISFPPTHSPPIVSSA
jgi:hypothetical protein